MMKKQIAAIVLGVSVAGGVGTGVLANALTTKTPAAAAPDNATTHTPKPTSTKAHVTTTPTAKATTAKPAVKPASPSDLVIAPGRVGAARVGMSKQAALATGLFDADTPPPVEGCAVLPLTWKKPYFDMLDVMTLGNGEIASIGVRGKLIRTKSGLGVGSTYAQVRAAIEDKTPVEAGYSQSGLYEYDPQAGGWIGYLFNPPVDELKASTPVSFIEVTKGEQPGLMRDGC